MAFQFPAPGRRRGLPRWVLVTMVVLGLLLTFVCIWTMTLLRSDGDAHVIEGENVAPAFYRYQGRIFVGIPGQGYYLVPGADAGSFGRVGENLSGALGRDLQHAYCGTQSIPDLDARQIAFSDGSYVGDGKQAWYCSKEKPNPDYHWWQEFLHDDSPDNPAKPRMKDYQLVALGEVAPSFRFLFGRYASDNRQVWYEGHAVPGAHGARLERVTTRTSPGQTRDSDDYLRDDQSVFYDGQLVAGSDARSFVGVDPDNDPWGSHFGTDQSGHWWFGAQAFPQRVDDLDATGLTLLLADMSRAYHTLFRNPQGVWFWNPDVNGLQHACADPFGGETPAALRDDGLWRTSRGIFFARSREVWRHGRSDGSLQWRISEIVQLRNVNVADWRFLGELKHDIWTQGSLWQAGGMTYFMSQLGNGHAFAGTLYRVDDLALLTRLVQQQTLDASVLKRAGLRDLSSSEVRVACEAKTSPGHG